MESNTTQERSRQLAKLFGFSVVLLVLCGLATAQIFSQCKYVAKDPVTEPFHAYDRPPLFVVAVQSETCSPVSDLPGTA